MHSLWDESDLGLLEGVFPTTRRPAVAVPHLVTFHDDWVCAELGERNDYVVARLEELHLSQAPVADPSVPLGWRLVSTSTLKSISAAGRVLDDDVQFLGSDTLELNEDGHLECAKLLESFQDGGAKLVVWFEGCGSPGIVGLLTISDLNKQAVEKSEKLRECVGLTSRKAARKLLGPLVEIRNRVMHPVRPLMLQAEDVMSVRQALMGIKRLLNRTDPPQS